MDTLGVKVNQTSGRVRTALVPLAAVEEVSDHAKVKRLVASRTLKPLMDVARPAVNATSFQNTSGLTGQGVVIGIVDSGIDPNHADFAGRIERIWDQTVSGPGVPEGGYGVEFSGTTLTASRDADGHGTHVAGIAAGNGTKYRGIAVNSRLVIVKTSFQTAHIADAIRYVFRIADDLGLPAVCNLSLGGHFDPHDGTDPLSVTIDQVSGPGKIVCCAAGNEGTDNIHAELALGEPAIRQIRFQVPQNSVSMAELNAWYPGTDKLEIAIRRPGPGGQVTPFQKVFSTGQFTHTYTLGNATVRIQTPGPDPDNGDHNFRVTIVRATAGTVPSGVWELRVRNLTSVTGPLHVWALDNARSPQVMFTGAEATDRCKVGSPGAAAEAITVASYTTRVQWKDLDGNNRQVGLTKGTISDFSSEGPLRTGGEKPDVAAPGAMIASCLSADSDPDRASMISNNYLIIAGTSMACPFVTGLVALLLERNPALDPAGVKRLLKSASAVPNGPAGQFHEKWGFGLIDASHL